MSLGWMVLIAALVTVEKLGPWPDAARFVTAAVLAALAVGILVTPHDVPGLVIPSGHGMSSMGMHAAPMPGEPMHAAPMPGGPMHAAPMPGGPMHATPTPTR